MIKGPVANPRTLVHRNKRNYTVDAATFSTCLLSRYSSLLTSLVGKKKRLAQPRKAFDR
jgi:hypothetical protein